MDSSSSYKSEATGMTNWEYQDGRHSCCQLPNWHDVINYNAKPIPNPKTNLKIGPQSEHVGTAGFWTEILGTQCVHIEDWSMWEIEIGYVLLVMTIKLFIIVEF